MMLLLALAGRAGVLPCCALTSLWLLAVRGPVVTGDLFFVEEG